MLFSILKSLFTNKPMTSLSEITLAQAVHIALQISSSFEGNAGFGNVSGNFDGQGLSCGALSWTWTYGLQQGMVKEFNQSHPGLIEKLMPVMGKSYLNLVEMPVDESMPLVKSWSVAGVLNKEIASELQKLWSSPQMVEIEVSRAMKTGTEVYLHASRWAKSFGTQVTLHEFVFFFDVLVQNGSMQVSFLDVQEFVGTDISSAIEEVYEWCESQSLKDCKSNAELWRSLVLTEEQLYLMVLGFLRTRKALVQYQPSVMNRKGSIAALTGYCNGRVYDLRTLVPDAFLSTK
jgi:hypothetical protein